MAGRERADWLERRARARPRPARAPPAPGLAAPLRKLAAKHELAEWWAEAEAVLAPLMDLRRENVALADLLDRACRGGRGAVRREARGPREDGRALSAFIEELRGMRARPERMIEPRELHAALRDAMDRVAVRPPWGGHPRVAIYGLLEARMSRADLVICGGLNEGIWPASPRAGFAAAPPVLRALGVPGGDFRIGLAAHDLAGALGAPEVVLSRAAARRRRAGDPLALRAAGQGAAGRAICWHGTAKRDAVALARAARRCAAPAPLSAPEADAERRAAQGRRSSVTALDRLRSDPYQFYASAILGLRGSTRSMPNRRAAWQGTPAHEILERWHKAASRGALHADRRPRCSTR